MGSWFDGPSLPISHTPQLPETNRLSMPMTVLLGPGVPGHIPASHQPAQFMDINALTQSLSMDPKCPQPDTIEIGNPSQLVQFKISTKKYRI